MNSLNSKTPLGVSLFGIGIILSSLGQIAALNLEHYRYLFHDLPGWLLLGRYGISWGLRIFGLTVGIGILYRKEFARKLGLWLFAFTILTVICKHPYAGFENHIEYLRQNFFPYQDPNEFAGVSVVALTWGAVGLACLLDVIFAGCFIYYFTRPQIKKYFA